MKGWQKLYLIFCIKLQFGTFKRQEILCENKDNKMKQIQSKSKGVFAELLDLFLAFLLKNRLRCAPRLKSVPSHTVEARLREAGFLQRSWFMRRHEFSFAPKKND